MHVFSGVVYLTIILILGMAGRFTAERSSPVEIAGLYWHFVDLIWILVFTFIYLI
jgi:cytochrome c oxidase subunit III